MWSYLLISPAVLGATLVVSSSAMAADAQQAADALNPSVAKAETAETSEAKLNALAAVSETTAASEPVEEISQVAGTQTQAATADFATAAIESAIVGANTAPADANPQAASQPTSESLAAVEQTVAQPVENSVPAAQLEIPAAAATAVPEEI
ncbi:porin, partial [Microcoleus sp. HI-ES]|nr:porin [Microcoleus sp. HI-ES]